MNIGTLLTPPPKEKTAVALGLFDGLHLGHRDVLRRVTELAADGFCPAVFTFETDTVTSKGEGGVEVLLSRELKYEFFERLGIAYLLSPDFAEIRSMSAEDFVRAILFERLNAGAVVCGKDFTFGRGGKSGAAELTTLCGEYGIQVIVIPPALVDGEVVSSTLIRKCITDGDIEKANRLLGYEFQFRLPVVKGNELGRTMNFPTINQYFPKRQIVPRFGVYYSRTEIDGKAYFSITNVGIKPTIGNETAPLAETYIMDYSGDLYGQSIRVSLNAFIRPEIKFSGVQALFAQIASDIETAKEFIRKGK